ncbi:MAG: helix-turn-helix domain-containing protein [Clostridia bacterium]|nr:helix-turn-helix domain-containing protein [Clostridia bacterium]
MNADSLSQLKGIFQDILKETGTELSLTPFGGNETAFSLPYRGEEAKVYIRGKGEETENKIKLVRYLVSGSGKEERAAEDSLKNILLGEGGEWEAFRYMTKNNLADGKCFAADVVPDRRGDEAFKQIERCIEGKGDHAVRMDKSRIAIVKFSSGEESPVEFAQFIFQSLYEELGIRASVGVGCEVNSFSEIASSYTQAVTAVKLSEIFHSKGEVHSYREYLLVTMLEDLPEARIKDYMAQFRISNAAEVFSDPDLVTTAEQFLENDLNISETSRALFLHRNTLMYRLDKIKRITGLDLKDFSDAVTFRVISILYKLLKL